MITFTNSRGETIEFARDLPYRVISMPGVDGASAAVQMQKSAFLDGGIYINSLLEVRSIPIEFALHANNRDELNLHRMKLIRVFNSKIGEGTLRYNFGGVIKEIKAIVESGPSFVEGKQNETDRFQKGLINLLCPNPYWQDIETSKTEFAIWEPAFEFPFELSEEGVEMGVRTPSLIVNITNEGHVDTGMIIKFRALGTVVNPSLFNVNTREWIKLNRTLVAGEIVTINTNQGKKRIESLMSGMTNNIFNNIANGSKFLQLGVGDNIFRFDADNNPDALEVEIYHSQLYVGV